MAAPSASAAAVQVSRCASERLRSGHLWVYRSDVEATVPAELSPGALVTLRDGRGAVLGTGLWSTTSEIAARLVSREAGISRECYIEQVCYRLRTALQLRREIAPFTASDSAHRLVFSEADGLPGIVADRYNNLVLLQLLIQGTAQADLRAAAGTVLAEELAPGSGSLTVWERADPRMQRFEQLGDPPAAPLFSNAEGEAPSSTVFCVNGLRFEYDISAGQKTGAFLDQRLNYRAAAEWAGQLLRSMGRPGRALDICTYQGGFALHLAAVCERVTGVDASRSALQAADRNLARNPELRALQAGGVDWVEADAFELLRALDEAAQVGSSGSSGGKASGRTRSPASRVAGGDLPPGLSGRYDVIVLDPPAFAKSRRSAQDALRGYKELNLRALRLLQPGGLLVTCSCSHHVSLNDFREAVTSAALDGGRAVQVLESRGAAPDHPEMLALPETSYLKCLLCRVS